MKRLQFIFGFLAATIGGLIASKSEATPLAETPKLMAWAERIALESSRTHARRFTHLMHGKYCYGDYDHLGKMSPEQVAERQARCAKICGHCRYIHSLTVWPDPNYRRPPDHVLEALEEQPWCLTWRTEPPYKM